MISSSSFEAILYIYQSNGEVLRPKAVPIQNFLQELNFFEIRILLHPFS
jgi:hypothetical protein